MSSARNRIFVIEDDPVHRALVTELLLDAGYEVETASSGKAALAHLAAGNPPDLILLDLVMPEMDGWAFMSHRRNDTRLTQIPVVVMTGAGEKTLMRAPVASGYLAKPLVASTVLQTVERCLHIHRGRDGAA